MKWFIVLLVIAIIILIWFITTYNRFVTLRAKVKEAYSTMDVFLKKRYDLIPNLVSTVKGYAAHEKTTLEEVVEARGKALSGSGADKAKAEGELTNALSKLLMLKEAYPELKADTQFNKLSDNLSHLEEEIERSRRYYNGVVRALNEYILKVPSCIVASIMKVKEEAYFEVSSDSERENIKVEF